MNKAPRTRSISPMRAFGSKRRNKQNSGRSLSPLRRAFSSKRLEKDATEAPESPVNASRAKLLYKEAKRQLKYTELLGDVHHPEDADIEMENIMKTLQQCIELDPTHVNALTSLAGLSIQQHQTSRAVTLYRQAIGELSKHNKNLKKSQRSLLSETQFSLAWALESQGDIPQAVEAFQDVTKSAVFKEDFRRAAVAHVNIGMMQDAAGGEDKELNKTKAEEHFEKAIECSPKEGKTPLMIASYYSTRDFHSAVGYCKRALEMKPYYCDGNRLLAELYYSRLQQEITKMKDLNESHPLNEDHGKAYLGCVLRLESTAASTEGKEMMKICSRHLKVLEEHFPQLFELRKTKSDRHFERIL